MFSWTVSLKRGPVCPKGGPKTSRLACVTVPVGDKVFYFGGFYEGTTHYSDQIEVHVFNTVTLRWRKPPVSNGRGECSLEVPSMRWKHTAVLIEDIIYIWGGIVNCKITKRDSGWITVEGDHMDNVLYAFDVDTQRWFKPVVSGTVPEGRRRHSACVLGKIMFIYGGKQLTGFTIDINKLDTVTMVWSLINTRGTLPAGSSQHSATFIGTKMFVFGGSGGQRKYNNIRVFDTETNCWLSIPSAQLLPEERACHAAFAYNGELYIYGGINSALKRNLYDLWKFNPNTFSWKKVTVMGMVWDCVCCRYCCMEDRIIVFGSNQTQPILQFLDFSPSLKTLCKLAVIQYGVEHSGLPHNIKWELAAMTNKKQKDEEKKENKVSAKNQHT